VNHGQQKPTEKLFEFLIKRSYGRKEDYCHQDTKTPRESVHFGQKQFGALVAQHEFLGISDSSFVWVIGP
jgi:hypothetical protein